MIIHKSLLFSNFSFAQKSVKYKFSCFFLFNIVHFYQKGMKILPVIYLNNSADQYKLKDSNTNITRF